MKATHKTTSVDESSRVESCNCTLLRDSMLKLSIRSSYPPVCDAIHECAYTERQKERKRERKFLFLSPQVVAAAGGGGAISRRRLATIMLCTSIHLLLQCTMQTNKQTNKQQCARLCSLFLLSWNLGRGSMATARRDSCLESLECLFLLFHSPHSSSSRRRCT